MSFFKDPRVQAVLRDLAIALLVSLLTLLGYNTSVIQPQLGNIPAVADEPGFDVVPPGGVAAKAGNNVKTSHISQLTVTEDLDVGDNLSVTDDVMFWADLQLIGALDGYGDISANEDLTISKLLVLHPVTAISVTNGAAFTPTGSYQPLTSAGTVTPTITILPHGTVLRLVNTSNTSIVIEDTGIQMLSATITLGQYDSLALISDGTNWIQVATSNN